MYCISVWGNTYHTLLDPLLKLQKRSVRLVIGAGGYYHTFPIFQKLNILNLRNIYLYSVLIFLYRYNPQILPKSFSEFFIFNNDVHDYETRQQYHFHTPKLLTKPYQLPQLFRNVQI